MLATSGTESFVMFMYAAGKMQWTTAKYSYTEALAGINAGDGINYYTIPGSRTPNILNITRSTNVGIPGTWIFKVGGMYVCNGVGATEQVATVYVHICT